MPVPPAQHRGKPCFRHCQEHLCRAGEQHTEQWSELPPPTHRVNPFCISISSPFCGKEGRKGEVTFPVPPLVLSINALHRNKRKPPGCWSTKPTCQGGVPLGTWV